MISQNRLLRWRSGFLSELETLFGPRDPDYELGEIRSSTQGPRTIPREGSNHIADILLTPGAYGGAYSGQLAKWQMAHECLHLIDPYFHDPAEPPTIVLEEGLATWFQNQLQDRFVSCRKYILSQQLVSQFMPEYLPEKIRKFRSLGIRIHAITSEHLRREACQIDEFTAIELTKPFSGCCS